MARETKIHFKHEPFTARVAGRGETPIQCTPMVYDEDFRCGVALFFPEGDGLVWGLMSPRDLIAAWRGTEVLRRLSIIENATLCGAYFTGVRQPGKSDMKSHVEPTIAKIGRTTYDEIMSKPVPEEVVRAILDNQKEEFPPDLYPITDEVRAGTIKWRQEFADIGVRHPSDVDAEEREQDRTIAEFDRLLSSYSRSRGLLRQCLGMNHVEGALLALVEKGAKREHSDHVIIALAGVVGDLATSELGMTMLSFVPLSRDEFRRIMAGRRAEALTKSADWLAANARTRVGWFRRSKPVFTQNEARQLLDRLLDEFFPPRSVEESKASGQ